jgi:hypothetical protein
LKRTSHGKGEKRMTLLPIIYTSLLLFATLLFFVLMVSYISFKVKSKGTMPGSRQIEIPQPAPIIIPAKASPARVVVRESYPLDYSKLEKRIQYQTSSINNYRNEEHIRPSERKPRPIELSTRYSTNNYRSGKSSGFEKSRIKIVNTSEHPNFSSFRETTIIPKIKSAQGLTDMNLLNYYSDRNESGFVTLTAF